MGPFQTKYALRKNIRYAWLFRPDLNYRPNNECLGAKTIMNTTKSWIACLVLGSVFLTSAAIAQIYAGPPRPGSPLVSYQAVTQKYGVKWSRNSSQVHTGVDLAVPKGNGVFSIKNGEVVKTGSLGGSDGNYIIVKNSDGSFSGYLHVVLKAKKGQTIVRGEQIGTVYKDHLHLNLCKQMDGCQHGAFPNPTYKDMPVKKLSMYYRKPSY